MISDSKVIAAIMWLINASTLELEEFIGTEIPKYAILSHTWEEQEVSFKDMRSRRKREAKKGFAKIKKTCRLALKDGLQYAWVDTCCIDKRSSAELSEAINSMFMWYQKSEICYAFLSDLQPTSSLEDDFASRRWFSRGWTLQELIAPVKLYFYDSDWKNRGSKTRLAEKIATITRIDRSVLEHTTELTCLPVAEKMSWAAYRQTTRPEDLAYCLLGIFNINMPLLYGEGPRAFIRLQEEIIKTSNDLSIFAWTAPLPAAQDNEPPDEMLCSGVLATSPSYFDHGRERARHGLCQHDRPISVTSMGVAVDNNHICIRYDPVRAELYLGVFIGCFDEHGNGLFIKLQRFHINQYVRASPHLLIHDCRIPQPMSVNLQWKWTQMKQTQYLATQLSGSKDTEISLSTLSDVTNRWRSVIRFRYSPRELMILTAEPYGRWDEGSCTLVDIYPSTWGLLSFALNADETQGEEYPLEGSAHFALFVHSWEELGIPKAQFRLISHRVLTALASRGFTDINSPDAMLHEMDRQGIQPDSKIVLESPRPG